MLRVTDTEQTVWCESALNTKLTHSQTLMPMITDMLKNAGLTLADIAALAVAVGPGSFTGVRIGTSLVKGLAFGRNIPCAPVSLMEVLADNLFPMDGIYCPVCDARRAQVYNALFRAENGVLVRLTPDRLIPAKDLLHELAEQYTGVPVRLCGDAAEAVTRLADEIAPELLLPKTPTALLLSNGGAVARRGLACYLRGEAVDDLTLAPLYLRPCQAERERLEKEQNKKEI